MYGNGKGQLGLGGWMVLAAALLLGCGQTTPPETSKPTASVTPHPPLDDLPPSGSYRPPPGYQPPPASAPLDPSSPRTMPQVAGFPQSQAECTLESYGLAWRYGEDPRAPVMRRASVEECGPQAGLAHDPQIAQQHPRAGATITPPQIVTLYAPCDVKPPSPECEFD